MAQTEGIAWHRDLTTEYGKFENNHGLGASPAQSKTDLIINVEHRGPSYLVAIDKKTGQTTWKLDGIEGNSVPSPTLIGSKLFIGARLPEFAGEGMVKSNCCVDVATLQACTPESVWRADKAISDYASPVICGDFSYFINKAGVLYCLDTNTGEVHYASRLGTQCWGTPIVNGEFVYFFGKDGKTQVIKKGPEFEVAASNDLWDASDPPRPETYVEGQGGRPRWKAKVEANMVKGTPRPKKGNHHREVAAEDVERR